MGEAAREGSAHRPGQGLAALTWLLAAVVAFLPLVGWRLLRHLQTRERRDDLAEAWWQATEARLARFRLEHRLDEQVERRGRRFRSDLAAAPITSPQRAIAWLPRLRDRAFPPALRPLGTRLFAIWREPDGQWRPLSGPGLTASGRRLVGDLLAQLTAERSGTATDERLGNRRTRGLFGEAVGFAYLASRRGLATPIVWAHQAFGLIWDHDGERDRPARLAWLLALPHGLRHTLRPISRALDALGHRGPRRDWPVLTALVPLAEQTGPAARRHLHLPAGQAPRLLLAWLKRVLARPGIRRDGRVREVELPAGLLIDQPGGFWLRRDPVAADLPYELWQVSRVPRPPANAPPLATVATLALAMAVVLVGGHRLRTGTLPEPGLTAWFTGTLLVAGAVPLTALAFLGQLAITTATTREISETLRETRQQLEAVDRQGALITARFAALCRDSFRDRAWLQRFFDDPAACGPALRQETAALFAREHLDLRTVMVYRFGRDRFVVGREATPNDEDRASLDFNLATIYPAAIGQEPERRREIESNLGTQGDSFLALGRFTVSDQHTHAFIASRRRGFRVQTMAAEVLAAFDLVASAGRCLGAVMFRARPEAGHALYLRGEVARLGAAQPTHHYTFGRRAAGGISPVFPEDAQIWSYRAAPALTRVLQAAARSGAMQAVVGENAAWLALPCQQLPDLVLGAQLDLSASRRKASERWEWLLLGLVGLASLVTTLGWATARHLLAPLRRLQTSLALVAAGQLDVPFGSWRDDELGDLATAFGRMVIGLQERRALGRFVPGTLALNVAEAATDGSGAALRHGAILVSDLRDFTAISEREPPERVVVLLNDHLEAMAEAIRDAGGQVDRFIGDAVVAAFLGDLPAATTAALVAARAMQARHHQLQAVRRQAGVFTYQLGIGIAAGVVLVGTYGSHERREQALLGEPRERAETLETLSKQGRFSRIVVDATVAAHQRHEPFQAMDWRLDPGPAAFELALDPDPPGSAAEGPTR